MKQTAIGDEMIRTMTREVAHLRVPFSPPLGNLDLFLTWPCPWTEQGAWRSGWGFRASPPSWVHHSLGQPPEGKCESGEANMENERTNSRLLWSLGSSSFRGRGGLLKMMVHRNETKEREKR